MKNKIQKYEFITRVEKKSSIIRSCLAKEEKYTNKKEDKIYKKKKKEK